MNINPDEINTNFENNFVVANVTVYFCVTVCFGGTCRCDYAMRIDIAFIRLHIVDNGGICIKHRMLGCVYFGDLHDGACRPINKNKCDGNRFC